MRPLILMMVVMLHDDHRLEVTLHPSIFLLTTTSSPVTELVIWLPCVKIQVSWFWLPCELDSSLERLPVAAALASAPPSILSLNPQSLRFTCSSVPVDCSPLYPLCLAVPHG